MIPYILCPAFVRFEQSLYCESCMTTFIYIYYIYYIYMVYICYIYIHSIYIYIYISGIHCWRILWSSYKKLAWVGFESTTNKFLSDALTNWAIRPWVQLTLRANFVQLLQFHCLFRVRFHFCYCLHSRHIYFNQNFLDIFMCAKGYHTPTSYQTFPLLGSLQWKHNPL